MKRTLLSIFAAVVIALSLAQVTLGQNGKTFDDQLDALISSQGRIAEALEGLMASKKTPQEQWGEEFTYAMSMSSSGDIIDCIDDAVANGPSSDTYQETEWDVLFVPLKSAPGNTQWYRESFSDVNGDGMMDYVYLSTYSSFTKIRESCVYINNGTTLEKAHVCKAVYESSAWTYYGDCAEEES